MSLKPLFVFPFILILLVTSCHWGKPERIIVDPVYGKYVSGYSSGMKSRNEKIRVELRDDQLKDIKGKEQEVLKDLFTIEPEIPGHAEWVSDRVVEFIPDTILPVNELFTVSFNLGAVSNPDKEHETFRFQFATFPQNMNVYLDGLNTYEENDIEWQFIRGNVRISDQEDPFLVEKTISATYNGKPVEIHFNTDDETEGYDEYDYTENNPKNLYFRIDSIQRTATEGKLIVSWDGSSIQSLSRGQQEITVPAMGNFSLQSATVRDEDDQIVELFFSEPIAEQDFRGIIELEGISKLNYSVENNKVSLYLPERLLGQYKLTVHEGLKNYKGYGLKKSTYRFLSFEAPKPRLRLIGKGNILPNSQGLIFPFESISLRAVDVRVMKIMEKNVHYFLQVNDLDGADELTRFGKVIARKKIKLDTDPNANLKQWKRNVIDLSKLIQPEPGAIYRVSLRFTKKDAVCDCEQDDSDGEEQQNQDDWNENNWSSYFYDEFNSWQNYYDDESPCSDSYYEGKAVNRNILASDLGSVFKLDEDKTAHVFINDMLTTDPVQNATVEFYSYEQSLITSGQTNAEGMLDIRLKEKPFLMVTKRGKQRGYLKLRDGDANSLSKFEVDGETFKDGVRGYLYGERGVWRPGDSLYLNFMLYDETKKLPSSYPVKFQLKDPFGQVVYEVTKSKNVQGIYDFRMATRTEAVTGNYEAVATVGNQSFFKSVKIETIKPNRLKIDFRMDESGSPDSLANLSVRWLHGAVAKNLHATITAGYSATTTVFPGLKGYTFDSPLRPFAPNTETVFDGELDEKGNARPKVNIHPNSAAPGKLKATYVVKVFEAGGDFSIDRFQTVYSPYKTYVGLQVPEMKDYDQTLETGKNQRFGVVAVNEQGKLIKAAKLQVKIYKLKWRWWYEQDESDLMTYISRSGTVAVKDTTIDASSGKGSFYYKVKNDNYGRYLITVTDPVGGHQTGQIVYFDWSYWNRGNRKENEQVKMLSFSSDKTSYNKGEKIHLSFPSPQSGRALVSIETGRKVVKKFWVKTVKGETNCEFEATADMAPTAYIHVTMIQPHAQTVNDLPIRMYGVIPVRIDDPQTHLFPVISMPDVIRPESTASVTVSETHGKKMVYTLAVVDEGLLDLTRFSTPQPWNKFYAKEALGVKTWDMYDEVIGAYAGKLTDLISIGGDGSEEPGSGPKANRFKPMVRFIGPFVLDAGQKKTHKIDVPNYMGSVRVMVVAHNNNGAFGNAEKAVFVRKPLMILASFPRVVGPDEIVTVPVTVFATENHVRNVSLAISGNDFFEVVGDKTNQLKFTENGEQLSYFKVRVKRMAGIGTLTINGQSGKETAHDEVEVDVRPPNPAVNKVYNFTIEKGKTLDEQLAHFGITGTNKVNIEIASAPSVGLEKRMEYLISYPHGCVEQTTSAAFPQLYVGNMMDLDDKQQKSIVKNVQAAINRLIGFQTAEGGFSYWPGENYAQEWATNYAGHFLIEAQEAGYSIPGGILDNWLGFQQVKAQNWVPGSFYGRVESDELNQAYRLYTLALYKHAEIGAMNRLKEKNGLSVAASWRLAAAYQLAGLYEVARKMTAKLPLSVSGYRELSGSFGSQTRDQAMILEALVLTNDQSRAETVASQLAEKMRSDQWMSTQETAYSLMALSTFSGIKKSAGKVSYTYNFQQKGQKQVSTSKVYSKLTFSDPKMNGKSPLNIVNTGTSKLFVTVILTGVPSAESMKAQSNGISVSLKFAANSGSQISVDKLAQGTEFEAVLTLKNTSKSRYIKELSITQLFPSGWEIHNTRMDETDNNSAARYQDFRDDRVYSYLDLSPLETKVIRVRLNASYLGKFYLPGTYTEAMYDRTINAFLPGKWIEVVK